MEPKVFVTEEVMVGEVEGRWKMGVGFRHQREDLGIDLFTSVMLTYRTRNDTRAIVVVAAIATSSVRTVAL